MTVLIVFLVLCFIAGGARRGRVLRDHGSLFAVVAAMVAASFYLLRVVM